MIDYLVEKYFTDRTIYSDLESSLFAYLQHSSSHGFIASRDHSLAKDPTNLVLQLQTVPALPESGSDGSWFVGSAEAVWKRRESLRNELERTSVDIRVERLKLADSEEITLCEHQAWSGLILRSDWPLSISPLICADCGGLVARCRVPVSEDVCSSLWRWDVQAACVEACWSASGELEHWADSERHDTSSCLNTLGRTIAGSIHEQLKIDCMAYMPSREVS